MQRLHIFFLCALILIPVTHIAILEYLSSVHAINRRDMSQPEGASVGERTMTQTVPAAAVEPAFDLTNVSYAAMPVDLTSTSYAAPPAAAHEIDPGLGRGNSGDAPDPATSEQAAVTPSQKQGRDAGLPAPRARSQLPAVSVTAIALIAASAASSSADDAADGAGADALAPVTTPPAPMELLVNDPTPRPGGFESKLTSPVALRRRRFSFPNNSFVSLQQVRLARAGARV